VTELVALYVALAVSAIVAYPVLKALVALKSRQTIYNLAPESHQKKQGTPTMGGIIILIGLCIAILVSSQDWRLCAWILGFALIGFTDDFVVPRLMKGKRGLGWKQKILAQIVLAVLAAPIFHLPWNGLTVAVTAFLVLFFSNAYNFADGLDGLAGALGVLLCIGFIALATNFLEGEPVILALLALVGGIIPFLFLNAPPAKVFMGDVGSLPIGALFGAAASVVIFGHPITVNNYPPMWPIVLILSLVMVAELVPVPMQVGYYKLTKKRLFPMTPIHHAFEVKGWPESRVVWTFILTQLLLDTMAISTSLFFANRGLVAR
jgi:phospho-N-acetylmuramoyl-pentapeptide-transferase